MRSAFFEGSGEVENHQSEGLPIWVDPPPPSHRSEMKKLGVKMVTPPPNDQLN